MNAGGGGKAPEIADLSGDGHRGQGVDATQTPECRDGPIERRRCSGLVDLRVDCFELGIPSAAGSKIVIEGYSGGGLVEELGLDPSIEIFWLQPLLLPGKRRPWRSEKLLTRC